MNAIAFNAQTVVADVLIDAKDSLSPIPIIKLKSALKAQAAHTVLGVATTDPNIERDLRAFCTATGHTYLGVDQLDGHTVHYIKKQVIDCQACSTARVVVGGVAAIGALAYAAPQVVHGDPSTPVTLVFLAALLALPPLVVNNTRLLKALIRKNMRG